MSAFSSLNKFSFDFQEPRSNLRGQRDKYWNNERHEEEQRERKYIPLSAHVLYFK